jgi:hypothetical protein
MAFMPGQAGRFRREAFDLLRNSEKRQHYDRVAAIDVRFGSLTDIAPTLPNVRFTPQKRTF